MSSSFLRVPCPAGSGVATSFIMHLLVVVVALAALVGSGSCAEPAGPVNVTVYYESLCPDSIKFYINQLYPTMEITNLSTKVSLELIPYGKSQYTRADDGSLTFTCHHGERECYGNKVHACALNILTSKRERLSYLNCLLGSMLKDRQAVFPADKCAEDVGIGAQLPQIIECANKTQGNELLAEMGNKTQLLQPKLTSVPTVVFNNKYDQNDFKDSQTNFKGVLCKYISPKPAECAGLNGSTTLAASVLLLLSSTALFVFQ